MLSLRDDARFLRLAGHNQEVIEALKRSLDQTRTMVTAESAEVFADIQVDVLALLRAANCKPAN